MATKIKLMRMGKMRNPQYRIVVADARTKRDGRSIETIGKYHPKEDPSLIQIDGERAAYWLGVGAQPTEPVAVLLKITGDWQKYKGEPAPPPMRVAEEKVDKKIAFEAAHKAGLADEAAAATTPKKKAPKAEPKADEAKADEVKADEVKAEEPKAADAPAADEAPAAEAAAETTEA